MKQNRLQRSREGEKAGIFGLGCNLILAAAKLLIGIAGNYIIVIADGANNLMDSISALIMILGFRMGSVSEDEMHPYGHGRIEYIAGFLISLLILGKGASRKTENELRAILSECLEIESVEGITIHDYGPEKKVAAAQVNLVKNCDQEMLCRTVERVVRLCKDTMNIELSLYQSIY